MKFGIFHFATDYAMPVHELAPIVEDLGFESLFLPEHTHIPVRRETPYPAGEPLPRQYAHTVDTWAGLAAAAAVTKTLRLGSGVALVAEHHPITLAKQIATVDMLSGGRVILGIGGGWNREEARNHGIDPALRWGVLRESIEAMKAIWAGDEAEYHGRYVNFDPIWSWPKPVQRPHPPIFMGGGGAPILARVVRYCDGWMPIMGGSGYGLLAGKAKLEQLAAESGRTAPIAVTGWGAPQNPEVLERLAAGGIARVVFNIPIGPASETIPALEDCSELAKRFG